MHASPAIRTRAGTVSRGVIAMKAGTAAIGLTTTNSELIARRKYALRLTVSICRVPFQAAVCRKGIQAQLRRGTVTQIGNLRYTISRQIKTIRLTRDSPGSAF